MGLVVCGVSLSLLSQVHKECSGLLRARRKLQVREHGSNCLPLQVMGGARLRIGAWQLDAQDLG